jgi:type II secretion system protein N
VSEVLRARDFGAPVWQRIALVVGCIALFLLFCAVRFPYGRFRVPLETQLERATGAEIEIGSLRGRPGPALVTLVAAPVHVDFEDGRSLALESAAVRPAWSLSWLRGAPALHVDVRAAAGRVRGTLWADAAAPGFAGRLDDVDLSVLAGFVPALGEVDLQGRVDADLGLWLGAGGPRGELSLHARDGSLTPPGVPVAVPFQTLQAEAHRAEEGPLELARVSLDGPLLSGSLHGTIGPAPAPADAPLDLEVAIDRIDPALAAVAGPRGARRAAAGASLRIGGTLGEPVVR